jgi:hypothetical protein
VSVELVEVGPVEEVFLYDSEEVEVGSVEVIPVDVGPVDEVSL